jgi:hypothetical protein
MFTYDTRNRNIKTTPFEITFGLEPRRQYGEDIGNEMFQRLQVCQNLASKVANENKDKSIEVSTEYFISKVKLLEFKELVKQLNFLHK